MKRFDASWLVLVAVVLFMLAVIVGFVAGVVMCLASGGRDGSGLLYSFGLVLMVSLMGVVNSRKRK